MKTEKTYWTIQAHSSEDGWYDWFGTYSKIGDAKGAIAKFRKLNQAQPLRILKHRDVATIAATDGAQPS